MPEATDEHQEFEQPLPRKSRWGYPDLKIFIPGVPPCLPNTLSPLEFRALLYRIRIEEITQKLTVGNLDIDTSENRSPSPPPLYDNNGKRTNTREQRTKEKLLRERQDLIQRAQRINPSFRPPSDYRPMSTRKFRKIHIPVDKYPDYNFIGLIIGPRGLTQKKMEKDSGAKIAIRGKGSMKDGKGRMSGKMNPGDDEPLHVLLTADNEDSINKAEAMVKKLLVPIEEGQNEHKRQQLETLARINGTLRDNMWKGSVDGDSPKGPGGISCSVCGEISHPTRDCPMKGQGDNRFDEEISAFFGELGDTSRPIRKGFTEEELDTEEHHQAYEELLSILNGNHPQNDSGLRPAYESQQGWTSNANDHHHHHQGGWSNMGNSHQTPYGPPSNSWSQNPPAPHSYPNQQQYTGNTNYGSNNHSSQSNPSPYGPPPGWQQGASSYGPPNY